MHSIILGICTIMAVALKKMLMKQSNGSTRQLHKDIAELRVL